MTATLVVVSIGPVQEFIAAGRRTRDFWMGSTILGEFSRAVARTVAERLSREALIFPAPESDQSLRAIHFEESNSQLHSSDVSNVILFVAPDEASVPSLVKDLKQSANDRWRSLAEGAARRCREELRDDWARQLRPSPVEFYAAWAPLSDGYAHARGEAMRLLAGRKACRDFEPWQGAALPKSSLDAGRETVLTEIDARNPRRRRGLHAKPSEQLDLVGIVKRADWGHDAIRYPSVSRVAIDPWIRGVRAAAADDAETSSLFEAILDESRKLRLRGRREKNRWNIEDDIAKFPWLDTFPYEGTVLYASRYRELVEELIEQAPAEEAESLEQVRILARERLAPLREALAQLQGRHAFSEPWQYLALLSADGDAMGRVLSEIAKLPDGANHHREFTRAQSRFAEKAREIVNGKVLVDGSRISGVAVYASADDILAFVAVDHALKLAEALRGTFAQEVGTVAEKLGAGAPTLSVGIAIAHFMEPLEDLLEFARAAERRAKNPLATDVGQEPRNALAIAIHTRGGAPLTVRDHWRASSADSESFVQRISDWAELHRRKHLSVKAAYDLRALAGDYPEGDNGELRLEALRVLGRKRANPESAEVVARARKLLAGVRSARDLRVIADELVIGQWLGDAMDQASGMRASKNAQQQEAGEVTP